ncbi:hypothetical protein BV898_19254 [Hypsibius exemplaris]|uniref:Uncharacterized protein n=1 Tax=Hypsibius exemplaris TaxID=2072580 RepID=A0A9X6RPA3_HYPEX|nr:hypothetical protein BV898_19254 [Hypsibius exemplaris]
MGLPGIETYDFVSVQRGRSALVVVISLLTVAGVDWKRERRAENPTGDQAVPQMKTKRFREMMLILLKIHGKVLSKWLKNLAEKLAF